QVVPKAVPGEIMGELKCLNQALLLQIGQGALLAELHRRGQAREGALVIGQALVPADVLTHRTPLIAVIAAERGWRSGLSLSICTASAYHRSEQGEAGTASASTL